MSRFAILSLLVLCACGENVCDRAEVWAEKCDVPWTDADQRACRNDYKTCTAREKQKLDAFWFCMDERKFFECSQGGPDTGVQTGPPPTAEDLAACRAEIEGVSLGCSRSIGVDAGTFGGLGATTTTPTTVSR